MFAEISIIKKIRAEATAGTINQAKDTLVTYIGRKQIVLEKSAKEGKTSKRRQRTMGTPTKRGVLAAVVAPKSEAFSNQSLTLPESLHV